MLASWYAGDFLNFERNNNVDSLQDSIHTKLCAGTVHPMAGSFILVFFCKRSICDCDNASETN